MKKTFIAILGLGLVIGGIYLIFTVCKKTELEGITLYGNVDLRQVDAAFLLNERVSEVNVEEGSWVKKGDKLASLETTRIKKELEAAAIACEAAKQNYLKVKNGPRQEEIARAQAALEAAKAVWENTKTRRERYVPLSKNQAVSVQEATDAKAAEKTAKAYVKVKEKELELLLAGSRVEDIRLAEAEWKRAEKEYDILQQKMADTVLYAPCDAVVRNRILEPGDMASPQRPVFLLSVMEVKWVRAYLTETQLGKVRTGMAAEVEADAFPKHVFKGQIGFISSMAEFTPKNVETPELRTALVYEVRIIVDDPEHKLCLGAPVTVRIWENSVANHP